MTIYIMKYTETGADQPRKFEASPSYTLLSKEWKALSASTNPNIIVTTMDEDITKHSVSNQKEVIALINSLS